MPGLGRPLEGGVALVARSDSTFGRRAVERFAADGARVHRADEKACHDGAAVRECIDEFGRLDILAIAPSDAPVVTFPDATIEDYRAAIRAGLRTTFLLAQEAARAMNEGGRICIAAPRRPEGIAPLTPAPATLVEGGLVALVRLLAVEVAPVDIAVNCLCPIDSSADAGSVAAALVFLASAEASYVTGALVAIHAERTDDRRWRSRGHWDAPWNARE